jgi:hypothetical protein
MQALFENNAEVFAYLLTRNDLDLSITDDGGNDIFYWARLGCHAPAIDYLGRLVEMRDTALQKTFLAAERAARTIASYNDELAFTSGRSHAFDPLSAAGSLWSSLSPEC